MRLDPNGRLIFAATDLSNFLSCRHKTTLELDVARRRRKRPIYKDDLAALLRQRGGEHETRYVEAERSAGQNPVSLAHLDFTQTDEAVSATIHAMRAGAEMIVQGALVSADGTWFGRPDVLRRVAGASALGAWHYEALDTKLACETRGTTILQLGLYSMLLADAQGVAPAHLRVVTPIAEETYRVGDFSSYCRFIRDRLETFAANPPATDPEPVEHCEVCVWSQECTSRRRSDDHLTFVAGMTRLQRRELSDRGVHTLQLLGTHGLPEGFTPRRGARESYERVADQARLQVQTRDTGRACYELLQGGAEASPYESVDGRVPDGVGFARLPEPSRADIFLDLEGSAFARGVSLGSGEGNREYLFGVVTLDESGAPIYQPFWAHDDKEERQAFEDVIDLIVRAWDRDTGMHVYHYAPYEPAAMKRLMGRYATRAVELDRLLRGGRFVDLYAVVRQGLRAGVEKYSIKNLEVFSGYTRAIDLREAGTRLRLFEHHLELGLLNDVSDDDRRVVQGYNEDDCRSTLALRDWLEARRGELIASGTDVPRPVPGDGEAGDDQKDKDARVEDLRARLLEGVPADAARRSADEHARYLLAYMLDFHRREDKATWWEYFRLRDLPEEDYGDDPNAIAGLEFVECVEVVRNKKTGKPTGSVINRYRYPLQEMEIHRGEELRLPVTGDPVGSVREVDRVGRTIVVKQGPSASQLRPVAVFKHENYRPGVIVDSIWDLANTIGFDLETGESYRAPRDLLLRRPPRLIDGRFVRTACESPVEFTVRAGLALDRTTLAIQGPPGTGKTFTGGEMICALVKAGRKVGVVANSHKVIVNLLDAALAAAPRHDVALRVVRKPKDGDDDGGAIRVERSIEEIAAGLSTGQVNVVGGTAWLWANQSMVNSVDVLFVDEAGQMSLANVFGASRAARNLVLLGDPQQLDQPKKGSHPDGVHISALDHVLNGAETMPADRGVFLPTTWRLAPDICTFTSEAFYEGRLGARDGLVNQRLEGDTAFHGAGLWIVPVGHADNQTSSPEEVDVVERIVRRMLERGVRWVNADGHAEPLTPDDFRVIAPYNAHVSRLLERLGPLGVQVGTVDKFQGQEAPVVIYSMATSRPEDAPRGLEFLYSLNRLNVATSRARCAAIVVASPALFDPNCRTPHQMRLANALCRLREMAAVVPPAAL